jgi:hypothetical protein
MQNLGLLEEQYPSISRSARFISLSDSLIFGSLYRRGLLAPFPNPQPEETGCPF